MGTIGVNAFSNKGETRKASKTFVKLGIASSTETNLSAFTRFDTMISNTNDGCRHILGKTTRCGHIGLDL